MSDGLDSHLLPDIRQIGVGCRNGADAGAREADLGGGSKFVYHIRMAFPLTLHKNLNQIIVLIFI